MMFDEPDERKATVPRREDIVHLCGDIADWKIAAILATGADVGVVATAVAWVNGEDDVMGDERRPLSGTAAAVYDILTADEQEDDRGP